MIIESDIGYDIFDETWKKPSLIWGNHGYNNSDPSMRPVFIAYGPSFKQSYTLPDQFENVDLYPLFNHLLGIQKVAPNNGTFALTRRVLKGEPDRY